MDDSPVAPAACATRGEFLASGQLNLWLGSALLVVGFALGIWLDPWSLGERDADRLYPTRRMHARHGQAVVVADAFFQFGLAMILAAHLRRSGLALCPTNGSVGWTSTSVGAKKATDQEVRATGESKATDQEVRATSRTLAAVVAVCGTGLYVTGWTLGIVAPAALWLAPCGAMLNLLAIALVMVGERRDAERTTTLAVLGVFALGMTINIAMALFAADPRRFLPDELGDVDGVHLRMLRLARAAVIALPVLVLLFRRLSAMRPEHEALKRWGERLLVGGAIGMPLVLVLAATVDLRAKYLLGLPAHLVLGGVVLGVVISWRERAVVAAGGWCLIAVSMTAGLLMGLYAFDGPVPAPEMIGQYNDFARRLTRLTHAYWIVQGMTALVMVAGTTVANKISPRRWRLAVGLLALGVIVTSFPVLLADAWGQAVYILGVGGLLSASAVACLAGCLTFHQPLTPAPP